jgi:hypothetical protein
LTVLQWDDKISTLLPPSSRGPGRGPFKAKTGVRIPVGALQRRAREGTSFFVDRRRRTADHCRRQAFQPVRRSRPSTNGGTNKRMKTAEGSLPGRSPVNEGRGETLCLCVLVVYFFLTTKTRRHNKQTADRGPQTAMRGGQAFQPVRRWTVDDRPWTVDRSMGFQARHGWRRHGRQGWSRGNRPVRRRFGRRLRYREQYHNGLCKG